MQVFKIGAATAISEEALEARIESMRLTKETKMITPVETAIKNVLLERQLVAYHHIYPFVTSDFTFHKPDFVVPQINIDGKWLTFECHVFSTDENNRVPLKECLVSNGFKSVWGDYFNIVTVNSNSTRKMERISGMRRKDFADKHVQLPYLRMRTEEVESIIGKRINKWVREGAYSKFHSKTEMKECILEAMRMKAQQDELKETLRACAPNIPIALISTARQNKH